MSWLRRCLGGGSWSDRWPRTSPRLSSREGTRRQPQSPDVAERRADLAELGLGQLPDCPAEPVGGAGHRGRMTARRAARDARQRRSRRSNGNSPCALETACGRQPRPATVRPSRSRRTSVGDMPKQHVERRSWHGTQRTRSQSTRRRLKSRFCLGCATPRPERYRGQRGCR